MTAATTPAAERATKFEPSPDIVRRAYINSMSKYREMYQASIEDPDTFWAEVAEGFYWKQKWNRVREFDFHGDISIKYFLGAKTNISYNALDRHLAKRGDQIAILWEGNEPGEDARLTYRQLHTEVCKFANVLKARGVKKGDRVSIYMPMVKELAITMLACARIGAVHSVVFGGFSADSLADRIVDSECKFLVTTDGVFRGAKAVTLKANADQAMKLAAEQGVEVANCVVYERVGKDKIQIDMKPGRDHWWHELMADASPQCEPPARPASPRACCTPSVGTWSSPPLPSSTSSTITMATSSGVPPTSVGSPATPISFTARCSAGPPPPCSRAFPPIPTPAASGTWWTSTRSTSSTPLPRPSGPSCAKAMRR